MQDATALDILKSAILLERRGKAFYGKVAEQSAVPAVREFFGMMAREEETHIQILSEQFSHYKERGAFGATPRQEQPSPELASTVLSERLQTSIAAADFEAAAISAAMAMERNAIRAYTGVHSPFVPDTDDGCAGR